MEPVAKAVNGGRLAIQLTEAAATRRRRELQLEKQAIVELLEAQLASLIDKAGAASGIVVQPIDRLLSSYDSMATLDANGFQNGKSSTAAAAEGSSDNDTADSGEPLPLKQFRLRNSLLTELFELAHFRTLQNIFIAIMSLFSLNTLFSDIIEGRSVWDTLSLPLVFWAFGRLSEAIAIWLLMHLAALLIFYPAFHYYVGSAGSKGHARLANLAWLAAYGAFQLWFLVQPIRMLLAAQLPPASSIIVLTEQARLMMKVHAFLWENARRGYSAHRAVGRPACPSFGRFLYFLFAPTLVYRDAYPRTESTRWGYVASNLAQVVAGTFFLYLVVVRYCLPVFSHWRRPSLSHFVHTVFQSAMPGGLILLIGFFAILHSWLNAFAEMLRFGDRMFYRDWWNVTSFRTWYRTWNTVVHDWLYAYVYRELCLSLGCEYRALATGCVFLLSAVFHELVISFSFGFFFPALFVFFSGAGFALMFANGRSRFWAVFVWASLFLGMGALLCLYSMEWFARRNCPIRYPESPLLDFLVPRSFTAC